ncbi:MAG: protein kinase, partial [Candidatus Aenigmatarchaeota archaeon]
MSGKIFLALLLVITFLFIPIVPIQTTERVPTKVTVPYTERESYVDYVPYQEWEKMSETFISTTNYNLKPGYFVYWSKYLPYDRKVTFYVSASDTVEVYVLSSLEYKNFYEGRSFSPEASRKDSKELQLVFLTRFNDTYYFIIKNPHTGFLGLFSKNVMIYSANANAIWEELVTKYREEIKYRDVVKYREETKYIDIPKTVYVSILSFPAGQLFGAIIILLMIISIVFTTTWQKKESVPKHHSESRVTQVLNFPDFPTPLTSKYEPLEFIGEGGFARVFKVKRKSDGKIVALKIPRLDEKTSSTFLREIASWYHLNHPNIVSLYSADILPVPYMEMEYVEGVEIDRRTIRDL